MAVFLAIALEVERVSLPRITKLARGEVILKPKNKRLWWLTDNPRVDVSDGMWGVIQKPMPENFKNRAL